MKSLLVMPKNQTKSFAKDMFIAIKVHQGSWVYKRGQLPKEGTLLNQPLLGQQIKNYRNSESKILVKMK
jgi:hypothetical protein